MTFPSRYDNLNHNLVGQLLLASPLLVGTEFAQAVVYVCSHSPKDGAMGVIINRRLAHPGIEDIFEQLEIIPNPPKRSLAVGFGGPVEPGRGFVFHSADWQGKGEVASGALASLNASVDILYSLARGEGPRHAMMLLGHAGWEAGQLEKEIFQENAWYVAPATGEILFRTPMPAKWEKAFHMIGISPSSLSTVVGES